jgi:hypothetical protein
MKIQTLGSLLMALAVTTAQAAESADTVNTWVEGVPGGSRVVITEVVVPANLPTTWKAIASSEGWRAWAAPFVEFEPLQPGAVIESSYAPNASRGDKANIRNRVLAYLPERMLAFQAFGAPPGFPYADLLGSVFNVIELQAIDSRHTRVRLTGIGYRDEEKFRGIERFFVEGNQMSLKQLAKHLNGEVIDWSRFAMPPGG